MHAQQPAGVGLCAALFTASAAATCAWSVGHGGCLRGAWAAMVARCRSASTARQVSAGFLLAALLAILQRSAARRRAARVEWARRRAGGGEGDGRGGGPAVVRAMGSAAAPHVGDGARRDFSSREIKRSRSSRDARSRQLPTPTFRVRGVATAVRRCLPTPLLRAPALSPHAPSHAPPHTWCTRGAVRRAHHRVHTPSATCSSCMPSPGARRDAATAGRR